MSKRLSTQWMACPDPRVRLQGGAVQATETGMGRIFSVGVFSFFVAPLLLMLAALHMGDARADMPRQSPASPSARVPFTSLGYGTVNLPITSMQSAKTVSTLIQQYDFSCGSAALATLLTYHYNTPTTEQQVFEWMFRHGDQSKIRREGFSLLDMKHYLAQLGMQADGFQLDLDKLNEAKTPAIVLINENGYQHFVVVKGLDKGRVLLGDPAQGTRAMSRATFEQSWPSKLLFVVHNRMGQGFFNLARDWHVAPRSPLAQGVGRTSVYDMVTPKNGAGSGDF